jgi:cysteine desulfurase/selenocysteine lyase
MLSPPPIAQLGSRALFPTLEARAYLNHAAVSPPSTVVQEAIAEVLDAYGREGVSALLHWRQVIEALRGRLGALLGVSASDLAFTTNTSQGVLSVALCLPWRPGSTVVCFDGEFPTNVTPWQRAAIRHDLQLEMLPVSPYASDVGRGLETLEGVLSRTDVQLVAVSAVQFQTGLRMPIEAMTALCHHHGAEVFVDAIQAVGAVPFDLGGLHVDYAAGGGHKWLMGLEGTGWLYAHPDRVASLRPEVAGWLSHTQGLDFLFHGEGHLRYDRPIRPRIDMVEAGVPNVVGLVGLYAAVGLITQIGVPAIWAHLCGYLDALDAGLQERGFESLRASARTAQSSILSVRPPDGVSAVALSKAMGVRGVACSVPDGKLRFAPHWPNAAAEVPLVLGALDEILETSDVRG